MSVPQIVMDGDSPRARRTDPVESHMAADATREQIKASQDIVELILAESFLPLDDGAIEKRAMRMLPLSGSRYRTARKELEEEGRVMKAGSHRVLNRETGRSSTRGLWRLKTYDEHFEYCEVCDVEHWFRIVHEDRMRYEVEVIGYCGTTQHLRTAEE